MVYFSILSSRPSVILYMRTAFLFINLFLWYPLQALVKDLRKSEEVVYYSFVCCFTNTPDSFVRELQFSVVGVLLKYS